MCISWNGKCHLKVVVAINNLVLISILSFFYRASYIIYLFLIKIIFVHVYICMCVCVCVYVSDFIVMVV